MRPKIFIEASRRRTVDVRVTENAGEIASYVENPAPKPE
jgi:hypothetical protein